MDGSRKSKAGLRYALSEFPDAELTVLHVMTPYEEWSVDGGDPSGARVDEWYDRSRAVADDVFEVAAEIASELNGQVDTDLAIGEPWREIVAYAREHDIDHVIMGSHGRSEEAPLPLGSVAETVMRRSPVLVSIVR